MTPSFPSPAQLVVENITLLAGSPTSFHSRYGFTITASTFEKPTHFNTAAAVFHFLLCIIERDAVQHLFKPCFPILDRQQERDFKKVVDARLAILERNKLLPHGCARKSVVSSAGGDRFIDLLWSLSSLAVQQACLSHPPYASSTSRIQLQPVHQPYDALSTASSSRSQRSLPSFSKSANSFATSKPPSSRRFLGMGMVSAAQQRAQNAHQMRARIDAQRAAMARTAEMGKHAALQWNSEAGSLRDKISDFEAKLRCLKMQLTAMGFDENGNDIRGGDAPQLDSSVTAQASALKAGAIKASSSADTLADELKTSPIDSTESGSSIGDAVDSVDGEPLCVDLKRLLTFADETRATREQLCADLDDVPSVNVSDASAQQIAGLVRAATEELQLANDRMDEIRDARREEQMVPQIRESSSEEELDEASATESSVEPQKASATPLPAAHRSEVDITSSSSTVTDEEKALHEHASKEFSASEVQLDEGDPTNPLRACVEDALKKHKAVLESSKKLTQEANEFVAKSEAALKLMEPIDSDESVKGDDQPCATNNSKPSWFIEASNEAAIIATRVEKNTASKRDTPQSENTKVSSEKDVQQAARLLEKSVASRSKSSTETSQRRRQKNGSRSLDCINLMTQSVTGSVELASENGSAMICTPSSIASSTKTARSVAVCGIASFL
ncbi:HAUS augmin-like complex subunit 6 [Gracilaria domingensis]|nr:HAUS augmin-like complex subunit 6 [Gracilaria domingensis]